MCLKDWHRGAYRHPRGIVSAQPPGPSLISEDPTLTRVRMCGMLGTARVAGSGFSVRLG